MHSDIEFCVRSQQKELFMSKNLDVTFPLMHRRWDI